MDLAASMDRQDAPASGLPPFKGLQYFDEADADLFFGRETVVAGLLARLVGSPPPPARPISSPLSGPPAAENHPLCGPAWSPLCAGTRRLPDGSSTFSRPPHARWKPWRPASPAKASPFQPPPPSSTTWPMTPVRCTCSCAGCWALGQPALQPTGPARDRPVRRALHPLPRRNRTPGLYREPDGRGPSPAA